MLVNEEFPTGFRKTILHMIWKQKGPSEVLKNSRFIHMKEGFLPRACEALIVNKMKDSILSSSSKFQVGGQPGHAPEEHIFTMKSLWEMLEMKESGMILTLVDIISFFDRENIYEIMQTLHESGVNKKAARLWFGLNEDTEISVKTAGGQSDAAFVGNCIGQGTAGAALVSQANLDKGLSQYFGDSKDEIVYGSLRIQPLAYQDDLIKGSKSVTGAQVGNIKLAAMLQDRGLDAHPDKTCYIVCGHSKYKEEIEKKIQENPIMFGSFEVKRRISDKYLGQMLHGGSLGESALATVEDRAGKIKGATLEIKTIIEEFQMQAIGGMMAAWELWEKAIIPSLLSGAGTWIGNCSKAVDLCDKLQNFFWRVMLSVPESCPKVALRCETGMIGMKWRIWQEKIFLLLRIKNHEEQTLCRQVYEEGKAMGWPGLWKEVTDICEVLGIPDVNHITVSKTAIKKAVFENHYKEMLVDINKSKKLEDIIKDDFREVQGYFHGKSVHKTRLSFRIRCRMVQDIPGNFKSKYSMNGRKMDGLICSHCPGDILSQNHCLICPAWAQLRQGLDLSNIQDLTIFFQKLLVERAKV